jgi:hypothetical protein
MACKAVESFRAIGLFSGGFEIHADALTSVMKTSTKVVKLNEDGQNSQA